MVKTWPTLILAAAIIFFAWASFIYQPAPKTTVPAVKVVTVPATTPATGCPPINERYDPGTGTTMSCAP